MTDLHRCASDPTSTEPLSATSSTLPVPVAARWPEPPQDVVPQDAPSAPAPAAAAAGPPRWSGRRTAAVAALALALTSAGALAAAAATPGISGPLPELRGGPGGGPGGFGVRQLGPGQQGPGTHGIPGRSVPGQGRGNH